MMCHCNDSGGGGEETQIRLDSGNKDVTYVT